MPPAASSPSPRSTTISTSRILLAVGLLIAVIALIVPVRDSTTTSTTRLLLRTLTSRVLPQALTRNPQALSSPNHHPTAPSTTSTTPTAANMSSSPGKTPVYFLSHGGPNIIEQTTHPAYKKLQAIGAEITGKVRPKGVLVFSGHWEGERSKIEINTSEITELIYDMYGFPSHYYEMKYPHVGSKELAENVMSKLAAAGIESEGVKRGLDHGVWASFTVAFNPETNPLTVPIVQASLFDSDDGDQHYRLGQALESLRSEGILIIGSGMAVHNLQEYFGADPFTPKAYTVSFDEALRDACEAAPEERREKFKQLTERRDARRAHPRFDHLFPVFVGAGAAGGDLGKQLFTMHEGSMSWAQYRFGEVGA